MSKNRRGFKYEDFVDMAAPVPDIINDSSDFDFRGTDRSRHFKDAGKKKTLMAVEGLKVNPDIKRLIVKRLIVSGAGSRYPSRSERDWAIINALLKAKYNFKTIETIFSNPHLGCSDRIREHDPEYLKQEVRRALEKRQRDSNPENNGFSLKPLASVVPKSVTWLWANRIPLGKVTLLVGNPDEGKSYFSIYMAAGVSRGRLWAVDGTRSVKGRVIILTAEDGFADTVRPRVDAAGGNSKMILFPEGSRGKGRNRQFNIVDDLRWLGDQIRTLGDVKLVIFDPITAYLKGRDANKTSAIREIMGLLSEFAEEHGAAVLAISHLNKNAAMQAIYRTTGSLAFVAAARSVWLIARDTKDESQSRRLFMPLKTNLSPAPPSSLAFRIVDGKLEFEPETVSVDPNSILGSEAAHRVYVSDRAEEFLQSQLQNGPIPSIELDKRAKGQGISPASLRRTKAKLCIQPFRRGSKWFCKLPDLP